MMYDTRMMGMIRYVHEYVCTSIRCSKYPVPLPLLRVYFVVECSCATRTAVFYSSIRVQRT